MSPNSSNTALGRARAACAARRWSEAYELLSAADGRGELEPESLELLADCARWTGRIDGVFDPLERAHAAHVARDDRRAAVRTALALCLAYGDASRPTVAAAWSKRADGLIEGLPEGPEHALHAWIRGQTHGWAGEVDAQARCAERALELARRHGARDVEALALVELAHVAGARGEASGLDLLDRATSLALGGEIGILASGMVFCSSIWACRCRGEWQRAQEWTDVSTQWVERQQVDYFPGMCRVHRAEVLRIRGDLAAAERECEAATRQVAKSLPAYAIFPWAELGEIRRRRGDHENAMAAFRKALELGWDPEPGLALLHLERGDARSALKTIERVILEPRPTWLREDRANIAGARVTIALAAGEPELAAKALADLEALASRSHTPWNRAVAALARGRFELDAGRAAAAVEHLTRARRTFGDLDAPYELATTCALLGRALFADRDRAGSRLQLEAARDVFARIGADLDRRRVEGELAAGAGDEPGARAVPPAAPAEPAAAVVRFDGDVFSISFRGRTVRSKNARGLEYLAALLARPGVECWAVDLAGIGAAGAGGDAGETIDAPARAAYRRRAEELAEELGETDSRTDPSRVEAIRAELDAIGRTLAAAVGLGGRSRRAGSGIEKARQSVTKAIRSAIRRIAASDPELGRYLEVTVKTGTACRFAPELREPVEWRVERGARR